MTPALQRLQVNEDDKIWRQNASTIRQLYQEERKTLKEVKTIMENDKGFPVTPLSIWEVKLRGLGMQKKLKARDWSLVYQHVRPRLQHEGKKKLRKPTAILINDTKKSWDDVWREIRRNHALIQRPHRGPLPPLPPGIVIRTPSPDLLRSTLQKPKIQSSQSLILQLFQTTLVGLQPLLELDSQSTVELSDVAVYPTPDSVYKMCLQGIPFTTLLEKISDTIQGALPSPHTVATDGGTQNDQITSALRPSDKSIAAGQVTSWECQLTSIIAQLLPRFESASPTGQELDLNFDSHHYLSMVVYLLANNIVPEPLLPEELHECTMAGILQMTFKFVPRRLLLALLHIHLPSIKAAWEKLLLGAQELEYREAFRVLISVGMENDWLEVHVKGHEYLFSAAQLNCSDILRALIARGCRADSNPSWCSYESIIVEALRNDNLDCAKLLIQHCDVNHEFYIVDDEKSTHFANFIMGFDDTSPDHHDCLDLLLKEGADVDYRIHLRHPLHNRKHPYWWYEDKLGYGGLDDNWPLSILDYVYYWHRSLFPKLAEYTGMVSQLSRARTLWHLDQGVDTLRQYLASDSDLPRRETIGNDTNEANSRQRKNHFLQVLLAEQFLLSVSDPVEKVWWTRVKRFSELEIDLAWLANTGLLAANILNATAWLITLGEGPDKDHGLHMLQWLLNKGFQVNADVLWSAYCKPDVAILACLASYCDDLKKEGGKALASAVLSSNFKATEMILDWGVDPNPAIAQSNNVFESAARGSSFAMMKYVVQRGAKPRTWADGIHPSRLLFDMLTGYDHDLSSKVHYVIEKYITINEPSCPSANILEVCLSKRSNIEERREIFEFLWKKGANLSPGSPLAKWIATGGGHRLVQDMLDAGADPNGRLYDNSVVINHPYERGQTPLQAAAGIGDFTLVCMLLDHGADLNGPAVGDYDKTALQAICIWDPLRREERLRKDKIVKSLLEKGADVNAVNSTGHTALFFAAALGDLSTAFALLKHGAKLDSISTTKDVEFGGSHKTALDAAAFNGRLDMVEFLLNANALSWTACSDGKDYDGAIQYSQKMGHFVISELICKHSADRKRWGMPHGQAVDTKMSPEQPSRSLSPRANCGTTSWPQNERRLTPSGNLQNVAGMDQTNGLSSGLEEDNIESGTAATKAEGRGMFGAEATDVSCTRVIEENEVESPLAETACEISSK